MSKARNLSEFLNAGGELSGNITFSGSQTVDGRDLSVDGSKLDGIEAGATADQTASEILTAIKTVDGSGSGLDADTVDGVQGSNFLRSDVSDEAAVIEFQGGVTYTPPAGGGSETATDVGIALTTGTRIVGAYGGYIRSLLEWNTSDDIVIGQNGTTLITGINLLPGSSGDAKVNGNKIWHAGNDGSGSGLDADLLDGQQGSYYTGYTDTAIANLIDSAPSTLDTLNELAAALGDDPNFATTVTNSIATKLPISGGTMTGNIAFSGAQTVDGRDLSVDGAKLDGIEAGATGDQTASEILTAIKTVDGSGSGLDADTVDGLQASSFVRKDNINNGTVTIKVNDADFIVSDATDGVTNFIWRDHSLSKLYLGTSAAVPTTRADMVTSEGDSYWHAGNDGSGSGLDADTLDGLNSGSFFRADTSNSVDVRLAASNGRGLRFWDSDSHKIWMSSTTDATWGGRLDSTSDYNMYFRMAGGTNRGFVFQNSSTEVFQIEGNGQTRQTGPAYVDTSQRVFADNYHPNADTLTTARTISLGGDVSGSSSFDGSANITITATVADDSHNHTISNVDGLQTALDAKANLSGATFTGAVLIDTGSTSTNALALRGTSPTLSFIDEGAEDDFYIHVNSNNFYVLRDTAGADTVGGGWDTPHPLQLEGDTNIGYMFGSRIFTDSYHPNADKWTTARTLSLSGDASGNVSWDGSGNATLTVTVADDSHNHIISNVDGLQTALDAKLASSSYTASDVLTKIKTVDGSGSGLDADTLDGQHGAYYQPASTALTTSTSFGGDVSGTYNNIVVANDSHTHSFNNLTGKTSGTGEYSTTGALVAGRGSGSVAMTVNDGYGNANLTFNHKSGTPDATGNAARIEVNVDASSGANMNFELKSGVTGGTAVGLTSILNLSETVVTAYKDFTSTGDINSTSDVRVKDNIEVIENAVDKIKQIRGVTFTRTDKEDVERRYAGVIAQEVQKVLPEVVGGDENNLTVAYGNMVGLLIEAIKEQQKQIEELRGIIQ